MLGGQCPQYTPATAANITDGIRRNVDTLYVNINGIRSPCYTAGNAQTAEQSVIYISDRKRDQMVKYLMHWHTIGSWVQGLIRLQRGITQTKFPPVLTLLQVFEPTTCQCDFGSTNGSVRCVVTSAIDPNTQSGVSGTSQNIAATRRRLGLSQWTP